MMGIDFSAQRLSYEKDELLEHQVPTAPFVLFEKWLSEAIAEQVIEPYAMSLATCGLDGKPSVRTLLLRQAKALSDGRLSLIFYSNYDSAKGQDLAENPNAEALFFWHQMERQVRLSGSVAKLSESDSDAYFHTRPFESQVAAWVSRPQSAVVDSRDTMEERFLELKKDYQDRQVPRPPFWGGYALMVERVEFWQGRANRVHDRLCYTFNKNLDGRWCIERLLP